MKRLQKLIWWLPCLLNTFFFCNIEGHGFIYTVLLISFALIATVFYIFSLVENKDVDDEEKALSNVFGILGCIFFFLNWNFVASISLFFFAVYRTIQFEEENNNKEIKTNNMNIDEKETMTETYIKNAIYQLCLTNGFIYNYGELKIYDPTEKDKDDLFNEVFSIDITANITMGWNDKELSANMPIVCNDKEYFSNYSHLTRCVQNIRTREEITVIIPFDNYTFRFGLYNKIKKYETIINEFWGQKNLCYSKREIEKVEIEKQIAKIDKPKYIGLQWDMFGNILDFYIDDEIVKDLSIQRKDLSKEKILQHIAKCKKKYEQKYENSNTIRKEIQNLFNE